MRRLMVGLTALMCAGLALAEGQDRWAVNADGTGIRWDAAKDAKLPHKDQIEMAGLGADLFLGYGVTDLHGLDIWRRRVIWPSIRTYPNETGSALNAVFDDGHVPYLMANGNRICEVVRDVVFDGVMTFTSDIAGTRLTSRRRFFPCARKMWTIELIELTNGGDGPVAITVQPREPLGVRLCCTGRYVPRARIVPADAVTLKPGETKCWTIGYSACRADTDEPVPDGPTELAARQARVREIADKVVLETGDPLFDTAFRMAKIRAGESIFNTRGGLFHSPGGDHYFAATWCNDQVEYACPWFAFTGDTTALAASTNAYLGYVPFMGPDYTPIPSSVIAEGYSYWNGAGDRGDAAMWAYGASRFALASGRRDWAERLRPGLRWALEYCKRRLNEEGVVLSDRDELEGRLPHGKANLCTSSLCYDALVHAAILERELGDATLAADYAKRAADLRTAMAKYFNAEIHGFQTYRYFEGCEVLRSWIGIPLCMGIYDRAEGTADAIFSPFLRTKSAGLLSAEGDKNGVTWDRSQLYAYRGLLAAGIVERTMDDLRLYTHARLLGEHVPYPVEAWPEGGNRHLSAESALYCRVFTEGLFGIDPTGFGTFAVNAHLPKGWKQMALRNIHAFGKVFDIEVTPSGTKILPR